jgi:hypothetical protein
VIKIVKKDNYDAIRDGIQSAFDGSLSEQRENLGFGWISKCIKEGVNDVFDKEAFMSKRELDKREWIFIAVKEGVKEAIKESIKDGSLKIDR